MRLYWEIEDMRLYWEIEGVAHLTLERSFQPHIVNVMALHVYEDFQNLGIGTALMKLALLEADHENVELWAIPTPGPGRKEDLIRFYRKLGFNDGGYMIRKPNQKGKLSAPR